MEEIKKENKFTNFFSSFTVKQKIWVVVGSLFFITAFVFLVLYLIEILLGVSPTNNPILQADNAFKGWTKLNFGFLIWGIIGIVIGALILAITLSFASKTEDRENERKARREARLKQMMEASKQTEEVVSEQKSE